MKKDLMQKHVIPNQWVKILINKGGITDTYNNKFFFKI